MDFLDQAKIRLNHWITHNQHHQEDYEIFLKQLQDEGHIESANHIRKMMTLAAESTDCLHKALEALDAKTS